MKVAMPIIVGVPAMTPVEAFRSSPVGKVPLLTAQVIGEVPEAVKATE